jgi:hypothetical protein
MGCGTDWPPAGSVVRSSAWRPSAWAAFAGALVESGEPTVAAIGGQTRRAFAALPSVARELLGDVPALVEQLEREAMLLRSSDATPDSVARLASAMAALDLLRLDLFRFVVEKASSPR